MASTAIDRLDGLSSSTAIKGPCRLATTANITLSGEQTIDGVSAVSGDRLLVKDQTDTTTNGIYVVDAGPWRRAKDFYGARDVVTGTRVYVTSGATQTNTVWSVSTANPVLVGTSNITFATAEVYQAASDNLTSWAAIERSAEFDAFAAAVPATGFADFVETPSSDNLRALMTDEVGASGGLVFNSAIVGAAEDFIPAEDFVPPITNGAQGGIRILATNSQALFYYGFDTTTSEILWAKWFPKKRYNGGTITFQPFWTAESGSGTVKFDLAAVAVSNDDPLNPSVGTLQGSTDTLLSAGDLHAGPVSAAITIAGTFADGDFVWLKLTRDVADTLGVDAQFLGLKIYYTTDQANDA